MHHETRNILKQKLAASGIDTHSQDFPLHVLNVLLNLVVVLLTDRGVHLHLVLRQHHSGRNAEYVGCQVSLDKAA